MLLKAVMGPKQKNHTDTVQFVEKLFQLVKLIMSTLREKYVTAVQTTLQEDLIMPIRN
jgi:hypothetical protein